MIAFGTYLGVDLVKNPNVAPIVIEAMACPPPSNWKEHITDDGSVFFHNESLKISSWEAPSDRFYMHLVQDAVKKKTSKTCVLQ